MTVLLPVLEGLAILLAAVAGGMFWGPWLALTISIRSFEPAAFLAIAGRLNRNMAALMTPLLPLTLLTMVPVLVLTAGRQPVTFWLTLLALGLYLAALLVTVLIEVPIVQQIVAWKLPTLPPNWQQLRDRWAAFHVVRVVAAVAGLACLVGGALAA